MTRLILLDRDGVINFDSPDYIRSADQWCPIPGSLEAIARLKNAGFAVAVCTNQSGVGRGLLAPAELEAIHARLHSALNELGAVLDSLEFCPHTPDAGCECRKPEPGMLHRAMSALGISAADTCFVGDSLRDIQAARAAGCEPILVRTGNGRTAEVEARSSGPLRVYDDLAAFARELAP